MNKTYFYPYEHINLEALLPALREYLSDIDKSAFDKYLDLVKNVTTFRLCIDLIYAYPELEENLILRKMLYSTQLMLDILMNCFGLIHVLERSEMFIRAYLQKQMLMLWMRILLTTSIVFVMI